RSSRTSASRLRGRAPMSRCPPTPEATMRPPARATAWTSATLPGRTTHPGTTPSTWSAGPPGVTNLRPVISDQSITKPRRVSRAPKPGRGLAPRCRRAGRHVRQVLLDRRAPRASQPRALRANELEDLGDVGGPSTLERQEHQAERCRHAAAQLLVLLRD